MFQFEHSLQAKIRSVTNRVESHGDDEVPAVSIGFEIEDTNEILDLIDPQLRPTFYRAKDEDQEDLPEVKSITPILRCNSLGQQHIERTYDGWTLEIDVGIDGEEEPMLFGGCRVDKFSFDAKQGGTVVLRFRVGTSDIDAERSGFLGTHVRQDAFIRLRAPDPKAEPIDGSVEAFKKDHPDAGDMFAAEHGGAPASDDDQAPADPDDDDGGDGRPMPEVSSRRTARGRSRMKAALQEGRQ